MAEFVFPIFLDGPLEGFAVAVPAETYFFDAAEYSFDDSTGMVVGHTVTYRIEQCGFHSGDGKPLLLRYAILGELSTEQLAKHMLSDYARKARIR